MSATDELMAQAARYLANTYARFPVVLVKGSRGMRLERVVEALTGQAAGGGH